MTRKVEKSIDVDVPVSTAYNQWTQFEDFPRFMGGVREVRQIDDRRMHWVAEIAGVQREWDATIVEQVPDRSVAWAATGGKANAGMVRFAPIDAGHTQVQLLLEYEPEGLVEQAGERLHLVDRQAESDLERFKEFIEGRQAESGGWRGTIAPGGIPEPSAEVGPAEPAARHRADTDEEPPPPETEPEYAPTGAYPPR
ncbi:Polyketide cyclase / dehydrase and lipid transport [Micromonospora humi]|uniref:Polyketide cyclase / dehydrase and lipid transport n=1 Tax=Micromonospora humi TaxID=745366 RepID=A0A1C5IM33_9ACTN|nr:Polyketide cyclase / dehydrase and lipid transport [Micromonospora humi]